MITTRIRLALILPLLLVFAQQGAMLHELSHLRNAGSTPVRYEANSLGDKLCETCAAFSQVGNPASAPTANLASVEVAKHVASEPTYSIVGAQAPAPRSRGPPHV
jgi:hypothetical protein